MFHSFNRLSLIKEKIEKTTRYILCHYFCYSSTVNVDGNVVYAQI